jgi:hypothetical protein
MIRNSGKHPGRLLPDGLVFRLDPTARVPCQVGHIFLARGPVNQAEDVCPHDATPIVDQGLPYRGHVSGRLRGLGKVVSCPRCRFSVSFRCRPSCAINLMVSGVEAPPCAGRLKWWSIEVYLAGATIRPNRGEPRHSCGGRGTLREHRRRRRIQITSRISWTHDTPAS